MTINIFALKEEHNGKIVVVRFFFVGYNMIFITKVFGVYIDYFVSLVIRVLLVIHVKTENGYAHDYSVNILVFC